MVKFGLSESLEEALPVARKYALLLFGQKKNENGHPCTTLDELSHLARPHLWDPDGRGWKLKEDRSIEPVMFLKAPAPKEVRDIIHLYYCPNVTHFVTDDNVDE
ncbi:hypothetical protein ABVT39_016598 [Epinephelus coioides]